MIMENKQDESHLDSDPATRPEQRSGAEPVQSVPPIPEDALIIVPVRGMVLFPGIVLPVVVGRKRSVAAAQDAARKERPVGLLLQRDPQAEAPGQMGRASWRERVVPCVWIPVGAVASKKTR